jgi:preprotein translocase subunit SecF
MWLLTLLPDSLLLYVVNIVLVVGAVGSFLSFFVLHKILNKFPALAPYHLLIQIVSAVLLVAGLYFKGGYSVEMAWREKVREMEEQVKIAEAKSSQANSDLAKKSKEKVKIVKEVQVVIKERIKTVEKKIDADCKVDPEAINIINDAAKNVGGKK